jgi:transposase-like protein
MGVSRRLFTKEFKLAAVRRLEQGISIAEAARALEVSNRLLCNLLSLLRDSPSDPSPPCDYTIPPVV